MKLHGWSREHRVVIVRTLKLVNPTPQDEFWDLPEDDVAVYVTNLEKPEATPEQIALSYARRADTENVFDELKNQWGGRSYCSQRAVVTELARGWCSVDLQPVESVHAADGVDTTAKR